MHQPRGKVLGKWLLLLVGGRSWGLRFEDVLLSWGRGCCGGGTGGLRCLLSSLCLPPAAVTAQRAWFGDFVG